MWQQAEHVSREREDGACRTLAKCIGDELLGEEVREGRNKESKKWPLLAREAFGNGKLLDNSCQGDIGSKFSAAAGENQPEKDRGLFLK